MRTPIKHYDKLFEIYGTDRTTEKHAESAKEKVKRWEKNKETINLNDDDSFLNMEEEWNEDPITPHATSFTIGHSAIGFQTKNAFFAKLNAKREFFGVPANVRLATLYELMKEAGAL
ncbi:hypothetical protein AHAS_Ahas17G0296400 [Arachis hypogaea]